MHAPARARAARIAKALAGGLAAVTIVAITVAGCADAAPSDPGRSAGQPPAGSASPSGGAASTGAGASPTPALTPVPGASASSAPTGTPSTTTITDWGEILDDVPRTFPVYPGAGIVDVAEPASLSFDVPVAADTVATWYRDALAGRGWSVELSDPLEDGTRVLEAGADIPECRVRMTFRPAGDSTIIVVLYAAACSLAGG